MIFFRGVAKIDEHVRAKGIFHVLVQQVLVEASGGGHISTPQVDYPDVALQLDKDNLMTMELNEPNFCSLHLLATSSHTLLRGKLENVRVQVCTKYHVEHMRV